MSRERAIGRPSRVFQQEIEKVVKPPSREGAARFIIRNCGIIPEFPQNEAADALPLAPWPSDHLVRHLLFPLRIEPGSFFLANS